MLATTNAQPDPKPGFPYRLFLALFLPVMGLILGGGWYIGQDRIKEQMGLVQANEINHVIRGVRNLDNGLHQPLLQLRALAADPVVLGAVASATPARLSGMEAVFAALVGYNPIYNQVRWIDASGMERVRVNNQGGQAVTVVKDQLQQVPDRYYFAPSMALKSGEVYVSPLDLNVERRQVETPWNPVLRLSTPVFDGQGVARGFLMVSVGGKALLDAFSDSLMEARDHGMLLNSQGYWLRGTGSEDEWGFMFGKKATLAERNPSVWKAMGEMESSQLEQADGLWTWSTVYPLKVESGQDASRLPYWFVVTQLSKDELATTREAAWRPVRSYTLMLLGVFGAFSVWLAYAIKSRTHAWVEAARAHAEAEHAHRLQEAQERFRLVVQANTNGLLVADSQGRIVMTNPALERMFGYEADALLGQPLDILLPESQRRGHGAQVAAYFHSPEARPMGGGRELMGQRRDGSVFPVEISLSPFSEKGETFVDAFVADISARRHSERLHALSEARLQVLVETNPYGMLVISDTGAVEMANPALERMLGYAHGGLYNLPVERLLPKALNPDFALWQANADEPQGQWRTLQWLRKDDAPLSLPVNLARFREEGRVLAILTVGAATRQGAPEWVLAQEMA